MIFLNRDFTQVESEYAEVKAQYEDLKMEVSRLEEEDIIYETLRFNREDIGEGARSGTDGVEER